MKIYNLTPGDRVTIGTITATFIAQTQHPLWTNLQLVTWWLPEEERWSHDALAINQDVGEVTPSTPEDRKRRLREALTPGQTRKAMSDV